MLLSRDEDKGCNKKQFYFLLLIILFRAMKNIKPEGSHCNSHLLWETATVSSLYIYTCISNYIYTTKSNRTPEFCMQPWNLFWTDTKISNLFCPPKLQSMHFQLCWIKTCVFPNLRDMNNSSAFGELLGHNKKSLAWLKQKRLSKRLQWRGSFQAVTIFKYISSFKKK